MLYMWNLQSDEEDSDPHIQNFLDMQKQKGQTKVTKKINSWLKFFELPNTKN